VVVHLVRRSASSPLEFQDAIDARAIDSTVLFFSVSSSGDVLWVKWKDIGA
jgi:hypothetical protein